MCISPFVTAVPPVKEKWGHVRDHVGCPGHELVGKTPFKICLSLLVECLFSVQPQLLGSR